MLFVGSIEMIFSSMLSCTIGSQGSLNKMAATNILWLHSLNNRSSIHFFFLRSITDFMRQKERADYFTLMVTRRAGTTLSP